MSVVGSLDAIATKVTAVAGIKQCYAVGVASDVRPIPRGIDDTPVATVWVGGAEGNTGNFEVILMQPTVDIWADASNAAWANRVLTQFIDLCRTAFRTDMNLGGECTRCEMVGWDAPVTEEVNGRQYLVLPIRLEVLIERFGSDATA